EPSWSVTVSSQGLVLNRAGQEPLALPYLEEQLPENRLNLTSEANGQRLELWAAPQRCVDSMSGAVQHLSAELRLNGQVMRGCAYFGGARED
ncbi:COG3650 family protein, partial [Pseudomonas sp.]|uniref:COG3650 family protein n=1 Tax=Pseudomonas sp. TaxID=306 RepID=UPI00356A204A